MEDLIKDIDKLKSKDNMSNSDIAELLKLDVKVIEAILDGSSNLSIEELADIHVSLKQKTKKDKKLNKILDLIFRFATTVMALVVVLLSINGYSNTSVMVALLAVGLACISITSLPKIEK